MPLFAIADTHLSHFKHKPMDIFGSRWKNHTEQIREKWIASVGSDDTVVIAGDVSWAMTLEEAKEDFLFLESLPGKKIISKGNHDYWWQTAKKITDFFEQNDIKSIELLHNNAYIVEDYVVCGTRGWYSEGASPKGNDYAKLVNREVSRLEMSLREGQAIAKGRELLVFLHFPAVFGGFVFRELVDVMHKFGVRRCYYGHIHGVYRVPPVSMFEGIEMRIISSDYLEFKPLMV